MQRHTNQEISFLLQEINFKWLDHKCYFSNSINIMQSDCNWTKPYKSNMHILLYTNISFIFSYFKIKIESKCHCEDCVPRLELLRCMCICKFKIYDIAFKMLHYCWYNTSWPLYIKVLAGLVQLCTNMHCLLNDTFICIQVSSVCTIKLSLFSI